MKKKNSSSGRMMSEGLNNGCNYNKRINISIKEKGKT